LQKSLLREYVKVKKERILNKYGNVREGFYKAFV